MPDAFVDTNVLVYAYADDPRAGIAEALLARGCATSVQGLNEFASVARRKLGMSWAEVTDAVGSIRVLCRAIAPLDIETHLDALRLAERYRFALFDASMIASALRLTCNTFWSEDMQDGMVVEDSLTIRNPFRAGAIEAEFDP